MANIGVGTELKRMLCKIGIHSTPTCLCDQRAMVMDEQGPDWCVENVGVIVEWMKEEAESRRLPFLAGAAKILVYTAVRSARKKRRMMSHD